MRALAPAAACLLVAGCGGGSGERNMTREEVKAQVADVRVRPGEWEHSTQVLRVEAPDMPRDLATQMQQRRTAFRYCITPEQAGQQRVSEAIARPGQGCTVRGFTMDGGRMTGQMVCRKGSPGEVATSMSGTYSPERFDYRSQVEMPAPMAAGRMRLEVRTTGRRIGPCPAEQGAEK